MQRLFSLAGMALVAFLGTAIFASAAEGPNGTSWTFKFSSNKAQQAVGTRSIIEPAKRDDKGTADESDDTYASAKKSTIRFPKGTSVDTSALKRCKLSASDVARGNDCPDKTRVGGGAAVALVGATAQGGGTRLNATIEGYNQKRGILFVVQTCGANTGPSSGRPCEPAGPPNVLEGKWSKPATAPKLVVPTPQSLLDVGVTILLFDLRTEKITKRVTVKIDGQKRRVLRSFVFTPAKCKRTWSSSATEEYVSGSPLTITDTAICRKA